MPKILVMEDDIDVLDAIKLRLETEQYEVITAWNGREGLDKYESEKPDLILMDIEMPQLDGYSFIKLFKSKYSLQDVPIVVLSGKSGMQDVLELEGVRGFLVKPCGVDDLLHKIKSCLKT